MHKLSQLQDGEWVEHSFSASYVLPEASAQVQRLLVGVPAGDPAVFLRLVTCLAPPYMLLYVLHTPRGEGEPGRYQSPEISSDELEAFIKKHKEYLSTDARFELWGYSPQEKATIVWDSHNRIFGYGPLDRFTTELEEIGFRPGNVEIPAPHAHNYHKELDSAAKNLIAEFNWAISPLHPEDGN